MVASWYSVMVWSDTKCTTLEEHIEMLALSPEHAAAQVWDILQARNRTEGTYLEVSRK